MGGGRGCHSTSYSAEDSPLHREGARPKCVYCRGQERLPWPAGLRGPPPASHLRCALPLGGRTPWTRGRGRAVGPPDLPLPSQRLQCQLMLSATGTCMHGWGLPALSIGGGLGKRRHGSCVSRGPGCLRAPPASERPGSRFSSPPPPPGLKQPARPRVLRPGCSP